MIPQPNIPSIPLYGPVAIHAFGVLVAIGIVVGARLTRKRGKELGLVDEDVAQMITWTLVGGFVFAHIFDVVAYQLPHNPTWEEMLNPFGGLSSYGGFMGALGGMFSWCLKKKKPFMPYACSLAYGLAAGWMFGRLGCFTAHDHPGRYSDFFLAVKYPDGSKHDLGLYEALWAGAVSAAFWVLARKKRPLGLYLAILTIAYAPIRFVLDFLRTEDAKYAGLTPAQYGSVLVLIAGIWVIAWMRKHPTPDAA